MIRRCLWLLAALAGSALADPLPPLPAADDARLVALITDAALDEISGIAASIRHPGVLWMHNDSGDGAVVHAVGEDGRRRASFTLRDVDAIDFEDMAAFELDGRPYLLIADTGDNGGLRRELQLYLVEEPETLVDGDVAVVRTIDFRWPDGPRDCEAVAVDPIAGDVLLVSKKRVPPELFRVSLHAPAGQLQTADVIGRLAGISQPNADDLRRNPRYGRYRSQITGADVSADGRTLAVLTYLQAYVWRRAPGEPWGNATARPPQQIGFPWLAQAEAIGFDRSGRSLWISSEHLPAPLLRIAIPAGEAQPPD